MPKRKIELQEEPSGSSSEDGNEDSEEKSKLMNAIDHSFTTVNGSNKKGHRCISNINVPDGMYEKSMNKIFCMKEGSIAR
jgi:hypothetical protein